MFSYSVSDVVAVLGLFIVANLVAYAVYNGLNIKYHPAYIALGVMVALLLLMYLFGVTVPGYGEFVLAVGIVIAVNSVLKYFGLAGY